MTADPIEALGSEFTAFLRPLERLFDNPPTIRHFRNYSRGLLTDLPRKTAEPLAPFASVPPRCLQPFLQACLWDHDGLTDAVPARLLAAVGDLPPDPLGTVGVLDETSAVKKGAKTPGVQRQGLGCVGKVRNGIVTVHLAVARGRFKALLDGDLYLPESWQADRDRCREADLPDDVRYRPKWRIGLELLARAERNGWRLDWLTFDEGYGGKPDFLRVLDAAGRTCVGEGPRTFSGRPGRRRTALGAEAVFAQAGVRRRAARSFRFPQQTGPQAVGQAQGVDVALGHDRRPRQRWILVRNRETGERKDFLTNAPRRIGVRRVLAAGFVRGNVEHVFRVAKGEVGLTHVAGQSCVSLKRPLALRLVVLAFVSLHTKRLRGEKRGGDPGAGGRDPGPGLPEVCAPAPGDD